MPEPHPKNPRYQLRVSPTAQRGLDCLPAKAAAAVVEFMLSALIENPYRVGKPMRRELIGVYAARRGPYRVLYEIDDDSRTVKVLRIDHRANVYRTG